MPGFRAQLKEVSDSLEAANVENAALKKANEQLAVQAEQDRKDIEEAVIEKLGGTATYLEKGVKRKLESAHKELEDNVTAKLTEHTDSLVKSVTAIASGNKTDIAAAVAKVEAVADAVESLKDVISNPQAKKLVKSKTFWGNILGVAAASALSQIGIEIPTEVYAIVAGGVNILLRTITKSPVKLR